MQELKNLLYCPVITPSWDSSSFLNSYFHKLSENVWVRESGARSFGEFWSGVTIAGRTTEKGKIELLSQWTMEG